MIVGTWRPQPGRLALALVVAALVAGCGEPPREPRRSSLPASTAPGTTVALQAKPDGTTRLAFVGWIGDEPVVAAWHSRDAADGWALWTWTGVAWALTGRLPNGGMPASDGRSLANVIDPESGGDDLAIMTAGRTVAVTLPAGAWSAGWRPIAGLVPAGANRGFLLVGAPAIAIASAGGEVGATPVPAGYVALAPTTDPDVFLLAAAKDAGEAGGLSASTPFDAYLWKLGDAQPRLVLGRVTNVRPSSHGLALLRTSEGDWVELAASGATTRQLRATTPGTVVGPDGRTTVSMPGSDAGCDAASWDPCTIVIVDRAGGQSTLAGPADGIDVQDGRLGMVLRPRPLLGLPWRLVTGSGSAPTVVPIQP